MIPISNTSKRLITPQKHLRIAPTPILETLDGNWIVKELKKERDSIDSNESELEETLVMEEGVIK